MIPKWMQIAIKEIGVKEIVGKNHSKRVLEYHAATGLKARDDETPWCGSFVAWVFKSAGIDYESVWAVSAGARQWLKWGRELKEPIPGCLAVFKRSGSPTAGHVGFYVGQNAKDPKLMDILGGNQGNEVKIAPYGQADLLGFRWPSDIPLPTGEQKLSESGVMRWSGFGIAGFLALIAENGQYIVGQLMSADGQLKQGTLISTVSAVVIIVALIGVMASRAKGKKDEVKIQEGGNAEPD